MKKPKTLILWGSDDLISQSVEHLLGGQENWTVLKISKERSIQNLVQEVERVKPKVVVITQMECDLDTLLPLRLIADHPELKVITVNLENNLLEVYNRQKVRVKEACDLISAVEN